MITLIGNMIRLKMMPNLASAGVSASHFLRRREKFELRHIKKLEQWANIKCLVEALFHNVPDAGKLLEQLDTIITNDLRELRSRAVAQDNATSLKVLELSAKIRKTVSDKQKSFIDRIIAGRTAALKGSRMVTFDVGPSVLSGVASSANKQQELYDCVCATTQPLLITAGNANATFAACQCLPRRRAEPRQFSRGSHESHRVLAEAHAEIEMLMKTTDMLTAQNAYLMKTIAAVNDDMSKAHQTVLMVNDNVKLLETEVTRFQDELKGASETLEEVDDDQLATARKLEKLDNENARLANEMADTNITVGNINTYMNDFGLKAGIAYLAEELAKADIAFEHEASTLTVSNLNKLTDENARSEKGLADMNSIITQAKSPLNPCATPFITNSESIHASSNITADVKGQSSPGEELNRYATDNRNSDVCADGLWLSDLAADHYEMANTGANVWSMEETTLCSTNSSD